MASRKAHYQSAIYDRRAKAVRDAARADPSTRCWRCGRTLDQHPLSKTGKPQQWVAGHVIDSDPASPLRAEASSCNAAAGARTGNMRRSSGYSWP